MGQIYHRETLVKNTGPRKKKNEKNRKRNMIMNFHVSPEEKDLIERRMSLTGLSKVDYFVDSCMHQRIHVVGNIKTFDAIRESVREIDNHIRSIEFTNEMDQGLLVELRTILEILDSVFKEDE